MGSQRRPGQYSPLLLDLSVESKEHNPMSYLSLLLDPQFMNLSGEIWILIFAVVGLTTYGLHLITQMKAVILSAILAPGAFMGNVAGRAWELIPVTTNITPDIVMQSCNACFAGMLASTAVWFLCKLIVPNVLPEKKVARPNEPKGVTG